MIYSKNMRAYFDTIAFSEIGPGLLAVSDDGYNVLVGSTPEKPLLFTDYSKHPQIHNVAMDSDAAGRFQFMGRFWPYYKNMLLLPDFGKLSQLKWCYQLIRECGAIGMVESGHIQDALFACRSRWASFPGAGYKQHEQLLSNLVAAYGAAGGVMA